MSRVLSYTLTYGMYRWWWFCVFFFLLCLCIRLIRTVSWCFSSPLSMPAPSMSQDHHGTAVTVRLRADASLAQFDHSADKWMRWCLRGRDAFTLTCGHSNKAICSSIVYIRRLLLHRKQRETRMHPQQQWWWHTLKTFWCFSTLHTDEHFKSLNSNWTDK